MRPPTFQMLFFSTEPKMVETKLVKPKLIEQELMPAAVEKF